MTEPRLFNVHCDESCHLEHDGVPVMAWGAVYCQADGSRAIAEAVRALKANHGLARDFEAEVDKGIARQGAFLPGAGGPVRCR